ncbi:hypothetical protein KC19_6G076800 [Ceratodon purpureus]|uniref:Protein kinase domain-containing protein n=1 Tax=Ceratodon purpureus TaxID=3225 RepID=A0A8T0HE65_CERPU|nr:hypothetical protein KC19_6G076800 [Ceratodon purpureus]
MATHKSVLTSRTSSQLDVVQCLCLAIAPFFVVLEIVLIVSTGSRSNKRISFPQFSSTDNILAFGDARLDPASHSFVINHLEPPGGKRVGTCGELVYGNKIRIQDVSTGQVASFSTSFAFRFRSRSGLVSWDNNDPTSFSMGCAFAFAFHHSEGLTAMQHMVSRLGRFGACQAPVYANGRSAMPAFFAVVFQTDYRNSSNPIPGRPRRWPSNNFVTVSSSGQQKEEGEINAYPIHVHDFCLRNETHCEYFSNSLGFTAWLDFDPMQKLEIRLANGSHSSVKKPLRPLIEIPGFQISKELGDEVYLTFWGSSDVNHIEVHEFLSWSFVSSVVGSKSLRQLIRGTDMIRWVALVVGVAGTIAAALIFYFAFWLPKRFRKHRYLNLDGSSGSRVFSFKELRKATKNFSQEEMLGNGGSGTVYRGCLDSPPGSIVAVKRITYESHSAEAAFFAEISSLSQIRHRNVVQLQGWCHEKGRLLLVYEYMPNGSLSECLYERGRNSRNLHNILSLKVRHHILEGVAAALQYLHEDSVQCILHRDIKSSNILLDSDFRARVGDFGLARLLDQNKVEKTTMAAGTLGYMAPEMPYTGKATKESDVYSFGILVLEVICGRRPLDVRAQEPENIVLLQSVWRAHAAGELLTVADQRLLQPASRSLSRTSSLNPNSSFVPSSSNSQNMDISTSVAENEAAERRMVKNLLHLGLLCCLPNPKARPSMGHVNRILLEIDENSDQNDVVSMPPLPANLYFNASTNTHKDSVWSPKAAKSVRSLRMVCSFGCGCSLQDRR